MIEFRNVSFSYGNVSEKKDSISEISFLSKKEKRYYFVAIQAVENLL